MPAFIAAALVLVVVQPWLARRLAHRGSGGVQRTHGQSWLPPLLFLFGIYGGYFGAAQGILIMAALGIGLDERLQRLNAIKNVLAGATNLVAGLVFVVATHIDWRVALLLAAGSALGGLIGARAGRRLPPQVLRLLIVLVGVIAIVRLIFP